MWNWKGKMTALEKLSDSILKELKTRGTWQYSRDEILELIGLNIQDVYVQIVSSANPLVDFKTSSFSQNDTGALISLLECLGFKEAPEHFWQAGLWLPYEVQVELQEHLLDEISVVRSQHKIEYETYLSMFDSVSNFHHSLDIYLEEYFSIEEISAKAIEKLLKAYSLKNENEREQLMRRMAHEMFRREIIPFRNLFSELFMTLKGFLISKGRLESPRREKPKLNEAQMSARQLFGYSESQIIERKELKQRYKNLMKKYHPDVNPRGLELAKDINRAYSTLLP